jgi:hypothetical protein
MFFYANSHSCAFFLARLAISRIFSTNHFFPAYPTCDFARLFDQSTRPKNTLGILSVRIAEIETPGSEAESFLAMREHLEILEAAPLLDEVQFSEDES